LTAVLTDADVDDASDQHGRPLRNFTPEQWRAITSLLPEGAKPDKLTWLGLLIAANLYWEDAARPSPREAARELTKIIESLEAALTRLWVLVPHQRYKLSQWSLFVGQLTYDRDALNDLVAMDKHRRGKKPDEIRYPGEISFMAPSFHRHEFIGHALKFWQDCGGQLRFSRPSGGPLLRFLETVCGIVMRDLAPPSETLRHIVRRSRRG
jgi:hypothetical protein